MTRRRRQTDLAIEIKRSWPLDMIAPIDEDEAHGFLLGRWADLAVHDLPKPAQRVALSSPVSWQKIAAALTTPRAVTSACENYVEGIRARLTRRWGSRDATITLERAGLIGDDVPTLEELGREWDLTRERIRQLVRNFGNEAAAELHWRAPLRLVLGAWFALHPGAPLSVDDLADSNTPTVERSAPPSTSSASASTLPARSGWRHPNSNGPQTRSSTNSQTW
jgi:hypothetical protein